MTEPSGRPDTPASGALPPRPLRSPGGVEGETLAETVQRWGVLMLRELHANEAKGGWMGMDPEALVAEVWWHAAKLALAVREGDITAAREYAADTANVALMAHDAASGRHSGQAEERPPAPVPKVLADQMYEALRLTREYVGPDLLPAMSGWSWYDAMTAYEDYAEAVG